MPNPKLLLFERSRVESPNQRTAQNHGQRGRASNGMVWMVSFYFRLVSCRVVGRGVVVVVFLWQRRSSRGSV